MFFSNSKYTFISSGVFADTETFFFNEKHCRNVFDAAECSYIYCEVCLLNLNFNIKNANIDLFFRCINLYDNTVLCELPKSFTIAADQSEWRAREGWGTPEVGWWQAGGYRWEVFDGKGLIASEDFWIYDVGLITPTHNPYFDIVGFRLYESGQQGLQRGYRRYVQQFGVKETEYINLEMTLQFIAQTDAQDVFCDMQIMIYDNNGNCKAITNKYCGATKEEIDARKPTIFDIGYGAANEPFWTMGNYVCCVQANAQLIAVVPFKIGKELIESNDFQPYRKNFI